MPSRLFLGFCSLALLLLSGCAGPAPYVYRYVPGKTAILRGCCAEAPQGAPSDVQAAVAAGNRIAGLPYGFGRGHGPTVDTAYDCSGATSFLLEAAGQLHSPIPSRAFRHYGQSGPGKWMSVYARRGHVFLVVAGLRFDTGWNGEHGPRWSTATRPTRGCVIRHPSGL